MRTRLLVLIAACLALTVPAASIAPAFAGDQDLSAAKAKKKKKKKKKKKTKKPVSYVGTWTGTLAAGGSIEVRTTTNGQIYVVVDKAQVTCTNNDGSTSPRQVKFSIQGQGKPSSKGHLGSTALHSTDGTEDGTITAEFGSKPAAGKLTYSVHRPGAVCEMTDGSWSAGRTK
jgi:hypothetical protein